MSWKAAVLIAAIWAFAEVHYVDAENRGFLFTMPKSLSKKSTTTFVLDLYGVKGSGTVTVKLLKTENDTLISETEVEIEAGERRNFIDLYMPFTTDYEVKVQMNGSFSEDDYTISGVDNVYIRDQSSYICFIQTDKPIYKPGQKVQFRILLVDGQFRPIGNEIEADIFVQDPYDARVAQFKNVTLSNGIRQLEFQLTGEPSLGNWKITVARGEEVNFGTFQVKEYVLPKFELIITPPSYVLVDAESILFEICAKYTYGKLVEGTIKLNASLESYSWSKEKFAEQEFEGEINGCINYTLNVSLIDPEYSYSYRRILVFAQVTEKGTGVVRNETKYVDRTQTPLQLRFLTDRMEYFKPGLPYHGKVKVTRPDDSAAAGEPVQICSTVSRERVLSEWWATRKVRNCRNLTSDHEGITRYTVQPQNTDAVSMALEAKSTKYGVTHTTSGKPTLYQPQTSTRLNPWYSPSGSHIQIESVGEALKCHTSQKIKVLYTSKENSNYGFHYEVIGRGQVLLRKSMNVSFTAEDDVSEVACDDVTLDAEEIQLVPPPEKDNDDEDEDENNSSSSESGNQCKVLRDARYVPYIGSTEIEIDIDASLSPSFKILVYYFRKDRETVADSQEFRVEKCFQNKVGFEFGDEVKQPGTKTTVTVTGSPNSICGVKVVDKSVSLLDSSDQLTKDKLFEAYERMDSGHYYPRNHCNDKTLQPGIPMKSTSSNYIMPPRPPRPWSSSSYGDAMTAFETVGHIVMSDFFLMLRPCKTNTYEAYGGVALASVGVRIGSANKAKAPAAYRPQASVPMADSLMPTASKSVVEVRSLFPETWLFQMEALSEDGVMTRTEVLPHTVTQWIGSAVCISKEDGLGLSDTDDIKGFQAFFLSYTLPYSCVRGETIPVIVTVFNYLDDSLPIRLELELSGGFLLISDSATTDICVGGGKSETYQFLVQPNIIGTVNFTVRGKSSDSSDVCSGFKTSDAEAEDAIMNPLIVESEGYPVEKVQSFLFCPKDAEGEIFTQNITITLPEGYVEDSQRAYVITSGDPMGPTIDGLDRLIRQPTGCGEQNMVLFAPNVYVYDYLLAIDKVTEEISTKVLQNLASGYQRQKKYVHPDGSYSAFGISDREGSMFLTAFVHRCFAQASKYINIDSYSVNKTQEWIISKQGQDGCFPEVGRTLSHGLKGGVDTKNSSASMTAYVLIALLTAGVKNETLVESAIKCMETETDLTPYKAALFSYALTMANSSVAEKYVDNLFEKSIDEGDQVYWKNVNGTQALDVETAAYSILAITKTIKDLKRSLPIVRWLTKNRNANGGFISTQDTVVALQALSQYAILINKDALQLDVTVEGTLNQEFEINEDNKMLVQRAKVDKVPGQLYVQATGTGCGLLQTDIRYNTIEPPKKEYFSLKIETKRSADEDCKYTTINICVRYLPEGKTSNMAIVETKMASGMSPVKLSLQKLKDDPQVGLKKYSYEKNTVVFYYDEISNDQKCFEFIVEEVTKIDNKKPATCKVSDYYAMERNAEGEYSIPDCE